MEASTRVRMTNDDSVTALHYAPPRGAWTVRLHGALPLDVRRRAARLLRGNPGLPWSVWHVVMGFSVVTERGEPLLASGVGASVQLWRGGEPAGTLRGHASIVRHVAFSETGALLASASYDNAVKLWRRVDGAARPARSRSPSLTRGARRGGAAPRASALASYGAAADYQRGGAAPRAPCAGPGGACAVCGVADGESAVALPCCGQRCHRACLAAWLAAAPDAGPAPPPVERPRAKSVAFEDECAEPGWRCVATLADHDREVLCVAVRGDLVVSGSWDGHVRAFAVGAAERGHGALVYARSGGFGAVRAVAFDAKTGATFASGSDDGAVRVWRAEDGAEVARLDCHASWVYGVAWSPRGALASSSQDDTVALHVPVRGTWERTAALRHDAWVYGVAFAHDGATLATASANYLVRLFAVDDDGAATHVADLRRHEGIVYGVAFSADGLTLASGSVDGTIVLWKAPDAARKLTREP